MLYNVYVIYKGVLIPHTLNFIMKTNFKSFIYSLESAYECPFKK